MIIIINEDNTYLDWLRRNPNGYVINCYKKPSPEYLVLHTSGCSHIQTDARSNWTTHQYVKACSMDRNELEEWAQNEVGGTVEYCSFCMST